MKPIRIGTRGSKLALYQANHVADLLSLQGLEYEIVTIDTKGDKILDVSISKIGSKGVFTEELEDQLKSGAIDIAVHSAKDLPSRLPDGFEIIAFTEREKVNDVIISHKKDLPDFTDSQSRLVFGTSSTRRVATLLHYYPHIKTTEVRGNLQTRISKMENGACDALLLAYAGVHRMGYDHMIIKELPLETFTPAVGQGSIAVEASDRLAPDLRKEITRVVHHPATGYCLEAERSFLKVLEGGCSIPVFALAQFSSDTKITLKGGIISLDGKKIISEQVSDSLEEARSIGQALAESVLAKGGDSILKEIRKHIK
ncbi:hydroxymethylbilane synthase [Negadavirga shengliensis]|uniref:Porphobilinogen deaminase n=1 Tax=Negadavirga shengliensis TaxID=1389218 RepID=A0ABV9T4G4_9BACT